MNLTTRVTRLDRHRAVTSPVVEAEPVPVESAADVLALVALAVQEARSDATATPLERARTLGALAGAALKAIEARDLEARVGALERVLKGRAERKRKEAKAWR